MSKVVFATPALYGDHHVIEVRRILLEKPGILEVYASSCFHIVEASYDPLQITTEDISACLASAGYLDQLPVESEPGVYTPRQGDGTGSFRHTVKYEQAGRSVSFSQNVLQPPRPAWPCPGMGLLSPPAK
jgi:hypothetical protein